MDDINVSLQEIEKIISEIQKLIKEYDNNAK